MAKHVTGTGTGYLTNGALTTGTYLIPVDTGTGTIVAGDVISIGSFQYVVASDLVGEVVAT